MIDVKKILQLDYLREFVSRCNKLVAEENNKKKKLYTYEQIMSMDDDSIKSLFGNLSCKKIIKMKNTVFIDETWEFFSLYADDLEHSKEQKRLLEQEAREEVLNFNNKLKEFNNGINSIIDDIKERFQLIELFIKLIEFDGLIPGEDIEKLNKMIVISPLFSNDDDRFEAHLKIIKYLIKNDKKFIPIDSVNPDIFNSKLGQVIKTSTFDDTKEEKVPYQDIILSYYETYKFLMQDVGYSDIYKLMEDSKDVVEFIDDNSLSKDAFCLHLGFLLYTLSNIYDIEIEKETLEKLSLLDKLYSENTINVSKKNEMLKQLEVFDSKVNGNEIKLIRKLRNRIKLLKSDLSDIISNSKFLELENEFKDIKWYIDNLSLILDLFKKVNMGIVNVDDTFKNLSDSSDIELLNSLREELLAFDDVIISDKNIKVVENRVNEIFALIDGIKIKLAGGEKTKSMDKVILKGFVLCDFDKNNQPYILNDLEKSHKNEMVDISIEPKKLTKGFTSYGKLMTDLFLRGNTEKLDNNDSQGYNTDKLNEPVYWDIKSRNHDNETGMYRLREDRNGVERFVEQRIVLHYGTMIYQQVTNIIKDIIPNVLFEPSCDINLYINYASGMKHTDEQLYNIAIKRFKRKSPLYRLFNEPKNKTELSEWECSLLKDIIHSSLGAFNKIEDINSELHFDFLRQIEEGRTRG